MADNLQQFNAEIQEFAKKVVPNEIVKFQKKIVLEALRRLVQKTPVDTGRAKGGWQVTIEAPASGQLDRTDKDGAGTVAEGLAAISHLPPWQMVWITNNVDYIEKLEHGGSQQAPQGMVSVTVAELRTMFKEVA